MNGFGDVLARESAPVWTFAGRPKDLAGNDQFLARQVSNGFAHHELGFAIGVHIGIIEKVDTLFKGLVDQSGSGAFFDLIAKSDP